MSTPLYDAMDRALNALRARTGKIADPISVTQTEDTLYVSPWASGAPLRALLTWHDELAEVERKCERFLSGEDAYCKITIRGLMDDVPVVATCVTFRDLPVGDISAEELRRVAAQELPIDQILEESIARES